MDIASTAQQSYVGNTQQSAAAAAVSSDSFGLDTSDDATDTASAAPAATTGTASNTTLSSQTLQALMNLLQGDPADSASAAKPRHHHHHGGGQPLANPGTVSSDTTATDSGTAGANFSADVGDSESATLATALGA